MKHGRMRRTPDVLPEWYRRWHDSQLYETGCYRVGGKIVVSPTLAAKLRTATLPGGGESLVGVMFGAGMDLVVSPHLPPPKWRNRKVRKAEKWKHRRRQIQRAAEDIAWQSKLDKSMGLFNPDAWRGFLTLN